MKRLALTLAFASTLAVAGAAHAALPVGAAAPEFTGKGGLAGKEIDFDLQKALKKGPVVLYFFPAAFTSGCTIEAHQFAEATPEFEKLHATIVGVTAGNAERVVEFSNKECRDKFAVVADPDASISAKYDAKLAFGPKTVSNRTSYVIGQNGKIALEYTAMDPNQHVAKTMAAVQALETK